MGENWSKGFFMKKYFYSCTYPWMCRSFDGFYLAPTKEMEVSHKTVAFA